MKVSIIIPVYNEEQTILTCLKRVGSIKLDSEIVVVNDGSTDGTLKKIREYKAKKVILINKPTNQGKGAAIRDALKTITGQTIIIQDADLEYDPDDYKMLLGPILQNKADVVFGSRFGGSLSHRVLYFWHFLGNKFLTFLTNLMTNLNLSDMETCYKVFTREVANNLNLQEDRFGFEPEFSIKVAKMDVRIYEVGVSYSGRNYAEGKKINWTDGVWALWCILKYGFSSQPFKLFKGRLPD